MNFTRENIFDTVTKYFCIVYMIFLMAWSAGCCDPMIPWPDWLMVTDRECLYWVIIPATDTRHHAVMGLETRALLYLHFYILHKFNIFSDICFSHPSSQPDKINTFHLAGAGRGKQLEIFVKTCSLLQKQSRLVLCFTTPLGCCLQNSLSGCPQKRW